MGIVSEIKKNANTNNTKKTRFVPYNGIHKDDEYATPKYAVEIIARYIPKDAIIWCPFDLPESNFVKVFEERGNIVYHSHICQGKDFLKGKINKKIDYIISNPPYSCKDLIYERLIDLNIPFAMLVNMQGIFDSKKRVELFKDKDVQLLYIYPRVCYIKDGIQTKGNIFQSGYICYKILPKNLIICNSEKGK